METPPPNASTKTVLVGNASTKRHSRNAVCLGLHLWSWLNVHLVLIHWKRRSLVLFQRKHASFILVKRKRIHETETKRVLKTCPRNASSKRILETPFILVYIFFGLGGMETRQQITVCLCLGCRRNDLTPGCWSNGTEIGPSMKYRSRLKLYIGWTYLCSLIRSKGMFTPLRPRLCSWLCWYHPLSPISDLVGNAVVLV